MTHRHDGSSIDIEKQLVRYMIEHKLTRRTLLERIAKVGAVTALAPIVAACTGGGASASPSAASAPPPPTGSVAPPSEAAAPTPVPSPEDELFVYNWTEYIGEDVVPSFEEKYGVKVTYDFFSNTDEAYAKLGDDGGGYDVSFPISVDIPDFIDRGAVIELDKSLIPNIVNLGAEWADPGYDPGNAHSVPVHVVDDRRRLRHLEDQGAADELEGALGRALDRATSRCSTTGRRCSRWR